MYSMEEYIKKSREAVSEGIIMLRNEDEVLPLAKESRVAVFGRSQFNYYKSGTGSGGSVYTSYVTGILEALEADCDIHINNTVKAAYVEWLKEHPFDTGKGWADEPWHQEEMPVEKEFVATAHKESDTAIIIIGRTAGEDQDNKAEAGSYLLTELEYQMLQTVCSVFKKTIVLLNVGNIIDMKWVDEIKPSSVLYVWQGGQEGGNGVLDILKGKVNPSGKLPDTIAYDINDYPSTKSFGDPKSIIYEEGIFVGYRYFETYAHEKVLYPFGFGMSYTTFLISPTKFDYDDINIEIQVIVKNTGKAAGKEVVQVYCEAPKGALEKSARVLCGFTKTTLLLPHEEQKIIITIPRYLVSSYDDLGVTGHRSCYVLESGTYNFYIGDSVRSELIAGSFEQSETIVVEQLEEALAPLKDRTIDPMKRRTEKLPKEAIYTGNKGYKLQHVQNGNISMEEFLSQLSDEELSCIFRGEGMCSPKVTPGVAGAFGGITEDLLAYGIPIACCADGPSGIRMDCGTLAFAMPNGTCLASSFNEELIQELYEWEALELRKHKIDTLLGPGINIHRNPLNGRNFEYFSEDPLLTGKIAAAQLRGMHKYQVTGTIKHFAANNQEFKRKSSDSIVSERALREIYLKGFEIAVKEGQAVSIMTGYNSINGFYAASNYDLLTTILRDEWGFKGIVMSDWWACGNDEGEKGTSKNIAAMIRAQNDLYMVVANAKNNSGEDNTLEALSKGTLTRAECIRSAANICRFLLTTPAYQRMLHGESELDIQLKDFTFPNEERISNVLDIYIAGEGAILENDLDTEKGAVNLVQVSVEERGLYRFEISVRAAVTVPELAQLPLTIVYGNEIIKTISITGRDKEWQIYVIEQLPATYHNNFYLKFFFGQSGIEIKDCNIVMIMSFEERIKQAIANL